MVTTNECSLEPKLHCLHIHDDAEPANTQCQSDRRDCNEAKTNFWRLLDTQDRLNICRQLLLAVCVDM